MGRCNLGSVFRVVLCLAVGGVPRVMTSPVVENVVAAATPVL